MPFHYVLPSYRNNSAGLLPLAGASWLVSALGVQDLGLGPGLDDTDCPGCLGVCDFPPQGTPRLCDTTSHVNYAEEMCRNKPKLAQDQGGKRKFLHEHQIPLSKALRTLKAFLRESEALHLRNQRNAQE